jgi:ABC-type antimicrobial peptide transport system permease subunit
MSSHHTAPPASPGIWCGFLTDLRHAFRLLWKSKRITATTLITLALCIGATTAIFSSVYSLVLKPLPYQEPERIVELYTSAVKAGLNHMPANVPFYLDYSPNSTSYESLGLWTFFYSLVVEKDAVVRTPGVRMIAETQTLGLKVVEGRFYEEADMAPGRRLFVVDQSFARKFFPNGSAVGGRFAFGGRSAKPEDWPVIVCVVKDVPHNGVEEKSGNPFIYQIMQGGRPGGLTLFLRTNRPVGDAVSALRDKVRSIDPASPLFDLGALPEAVDSSFDNRRAVMLLLVAFAGLAVFLSALGIYGVLAYDVSQRTREIGVRSAIGASQGQIAGLILRQGLWKGGMGVVLGLTGAALLSRSMTTLLFNVRPTDPAVYAAVSFVLIAVALLASYLPARRASRIDPLIALREE